MCECCRNRSPLDVATVFKVFPRASLAPRSRLHCVFFIPHLCHAACRIVIMAEDTESLLGARRWCRALSLEKGRLIWHVGDTVAPMCPLKGRFGVRGEAGKLKVVLLIRGCVCRGRPFDTSAALFEEGGGGIRWCCSCLPAESDTGSLGNVVLVLFFFFSNSSSWVTEKLHKQGKSTRLTQTDFKCLTIFKMKGKNKNYFKWCNSVI